MEVYPSVIHLLTTESWGGLEMYVFDLVKKISASGVRCGVYCLPNTVVHQKFENAGIKTFLAIKHSKYNLKDVLRLRMIVRKENFQIIHAHTNIDMWRGSWTINFDNKRRLIFNLYMGVIKKKDLIHSFVFHKIDALVSTSEIINNQVKESYPIRKEKVRLIRYGREVEEYIINQSVREEIRLKNGITESDIVVGTMCRIDIQKGVKEFVESYLLIPSELRKNLKYCLIGDPTILKKDENDKLIFEKESEEVYNYIIDFISKNNLSEHIKLIPFQSEMIPYLGAFDIFVLASYNEMYSLAVLDAMLLDLPVISTNKGGTPEQLGYGERGFLAEPKNAESIAEKIIACLKDPELSKQVAEKGKNWVNQEHSWNNVLKQYIELYKEVLKN